MNKFGKTYALDARLIDVGLGKGIISAEFSMSGEIDVQVHHLAMADFPVYHSTSEFRFDVTEESKLLIVHAAQEHFMRNHEVINLDGSRILFEDGWGLLRASNTQPAIVARYEAVTEAGLVNIREEVESFLESQGVEIGNEDQ